VLHPEDVFPDDREARLGEEVIDLVDAPRGRVLDGEGPGRSSLLDGLDISPKVAYPVNATRSGASVELLRGEVAARALDPKTDARGCLLVWFVVFRRKSCCRTESSMISWKDPVTKCASSRAHFPFEIGRARAPPPAGLP
jgi:hypothetical protein